MRETPWSGFHRRWPRLKPPLRPNAEVSAALTDLIADRSERALLLGVTPEFSDIALSTVAIDRSDKMIVLAWPGNSATRHAINGNWLSLPCADRCFSAVLGDGSLNCLNYPSEYERVYKELARVMRLGGRLAIRAYLTPESGDSLAGVREDAMAGRVKGIDALKWRLANAICAERRNPNVPVQDIHRAFNQQFPDRGALARALGSTSEDLEQVDAYEQMPDIFSFPTPQQLFACIPDNFVNARLVSAGTYELAERCPIFVMDSSHRLSDGIGSI